MEKAWRLRHEVFVDEKKWLALLKPDGREIDEFDDDRAIHMLAWDGDELVGYQRMLPTTRPYLLSAVYPELCEEEIPHSKTVWEWTRYAVKKEHRARGRMLSPTANHLLSAIVEWGLRDGVNSIIIEMNPLWMLRLVQLHFRVVPLGICQEMEGEDVLAVQAHFDRRTLQKLREVRGNIHSVLERESALAG
ncbi:MAG: acyl-homoserine-lactone synthase [Pseudomonadota bacterium]